MLQKGPFLSIYFWMADFGGTLFPDTDGTRLSLNGHNAIVISQINNKEDGKTMRILMMTVGVIIVKTSRSIETPNNSYEIHISIN